MLLSFFIAFVQRVLSGLTSMFGYREELIELQICSIVLILFPALFSGHDWLFWIFMLVYTISIIMKVVSFDNHARGWIAKYRDIHFWENLVTGIFVVFLAITGHNLLMLILSVYPALIIHKGLINIGSGLPFFAEATDDETGKTYSIPLLGIKIRRTSTNFRLIVAGISILGVVMAYLTNIQVSFSLF